MLRTAAVLVLPLLCCVAQGLFTAHRLPHPATAKPSAAQLRWMDLELGTMISYGIGMPNAPWAPPNTTCFGNFTAPPAALFNSTPNFPQWARAFQALGAKYSVIAASGGCGYALWPSQAKFPDGRRYNYSTAQSPLLGTSDIMQSYVDAMHAAKIGTGVYFQLEYDYWGGFLHGKMSANGPTAPKLSTEEYFNVTIQMLAEVWDPNQYGNHTELWFDGGLVGWSASAISAVGALMEKLQPDAVAFQGPTKVEAVRWVGNENGHAAEPNWIASDNAMANGPGHPNGSVVAPAEVDTPFATGQSIWWWSPGQTFKSLRELQIEYDNSVGHNANLLLGVTPDFTGSLPAAHIARYTEFGDWIRTCYGQHNILAEKKNVTLQVAEGKSTSVVLQLQPSRSSFDRLWIMEDISQGQKISGFTLEIQTAGGNWNTSQAWLFPCSTVGACGGGGGGPQGSGDAPWLPVKRHVAVFNGTAVGRKRIIKLCSNATTEQAAPVLNAVAIRLNVTKVIGDGLAILRSFAAFGSAQCVSK